MDLTMTLPGGEELEGTGPVVVIGPNGSGKTRQSRQIVSPAPIDYINALRNTRVATDLPAVGFDTAKANYASQRNNARYQPWELASEFDYMLSQLLAQQAMTAIDFMRRHRDDPQNAGEPARTPLTQVEQLWGHVFPGRELYWRDWKPLVKNDSTGSEVEYSGNQMSDGEKAALYLAGRVFSAEPGILVVDEPETHLHSLLAARLWNALEAARSDIRFVYVTHDLSFALSRQDPEFVLASPTEGLRKVVVAPSIPDDVAEALLGSASLSFHASRVVFCEGDSTSIDLELYEGWFKGLDTVVRPVGGWTRVMRCVEALAHSRIVSGLSVLGIVDGDYHPATFKEAIGTGVHVLDVHEAESLLCLPSVVEAACRHVGREFDLADYEAKLRATVGQNQADQIAVQRWKRDIEPRLEGLVAEVSGRRTPVGQLVNDLPTIFDHATWGFSPEDILRAAQDAVEAALNPEGDLMSFLAVVPGKQLLPVAGRQLGLEERSYRQLISRALLGGEPFRTLERDLEQALAPHLPDRYVHAHSLRGDVN